MSFAQWHRWWRGRRDESVDRGADRTGRGTARLGVEALEDRVVPALPVNPPQTDGVATAANGEVYASSYRDFGHVGAFDPATGTWYLRDGVGPGAPAAKFQYGAPGWVPLVGDWDGDGDATVGVFDPATATFYLRNANAPGAPDLAFQYGAPGWTPVAGDWDGNGTTTVGVFDPGSATWYLRDDNSPGAPSVNAFQYGAPGWRPVVGDWDGNGTANPGVFDPAGQWYLRYANSPGAPDVTPFEYGAGSWRPVAGNYQGPGGAAQLAADAELAADRSGERLTEAELAPVVAAALARWEAAGVGRAAVLAMQAADIRVGPLPGRYLGLADGNAITLDPNAAGRGWFVDPTPDDDAEFGPSGRRGVLVAGEGAAADRVDLLTVVMHELGRVAGLAPPDPQTYPDDIMAETLGAGVRRVTKGYGPKRPD